MGKPDQRPTMKDLVLTLAAVGTAIAAGKGKMGGKGKEFMEMMGSQGGKMPEMVQEMMAATMDDMQDMSMSPDTKLLSSGRAFDFEEPSERGTKKKVMKKMKGKKGKKPSKSKKP